MLSPFELTTPKLLAQQGYDSALFGKFHTALQGNYPAGLGMVHDLGWDYFAGWLDETGDPSSIDVTAGGISAVTGQSYACGFVPGASANGADVGACYLPDGTCRSLSSRGHSAIGSRTPPWSMQQRTISDMMIESMDEQIGRLLVETGLAQRGSNGALRYLPQASNTMVVVLGDNGSLAATVKQPFEYLRAKGTAYQTGVWVPLVVAGPLVEAGGREVPHMVNVADLYSLFAEIGGIEDVQGAVPRPIDAQPFMPYLTNPNQPSIRTWNYTELGLNLPVDGAVNGPCTISDSCTQIPVTKGRGLTGHPQKQKASRDTGMSASSRVGVSHAPPPYASGTSRGRAVRRAALTVLQSSA